MRLELVRRGADATAPAIILVDSEEHPTSLPAEPTGPCALLCLRVGDWARTLTPWEAPGLRHEDPPFAGQAASTLEALTERLLPALLAEHDLRPRSLGILGYSLAGLFALYATTATDLFRAVSSCSGSLWYEGWLDYLCETPPRVAFYHLSLGTKEKRAQNARLKRVERCHDECARILADHGVPCALEKVPGGHLDHVAERIAHGADVLSDVLMLP